MTTENVLTEPDDARFVRTDTYASYEVRFLDTGFTYRRTGGAAPTRGLIEPSRGRRSIG